MSESTREMLRAQLESTRETLDGLWAAVDKGDHGQCPSCSGSDEWQCEPLEFLAEMPLEVVWEKGEPFAVVLGTGGPHVEIRGGGRHDGSVYSLHGYWSGEHLRVFGEGVERTGAHFREMVEEG